MSDSDKKFIACLDNMTLEQARRELAWGTFGSPGSPNHNFASQWLAVKEAEERDKRDTIAKNQAAQIHNRLVELKKPHWSLTPIFIVTALAMLFAAIPAWPVIQRWFQSSPPDHISSSSQSPQSHSETKTQEPPQK